MKQRKTRILTIGAISLFRLLVLMGSQFITNRISTGNETENNLSAEINETENTEFSAFNYPYVSITDLKKNTDAETKFYRDFYSSSLVRNEQGEQVDYLTYFESKNYTPDETMISFTQAANIFGETIKYLYGYTRHTNKPVLLMYDEMYSYDGMAGAYNNRYAGLYVDEDKNIMISTVIEPITGRIEQFFADFSVDNHKYTERGELSATDEMYIKVMETVIKDLEILGYKESADKITISGVAYAKSSSYDYYTASVTLSNGMSAHLTYGTVNSEYFELNSFQLYAR